MSKSATKEDLIVFVHKLCDETDYAIINYCPEDSQLEELSSSFVDIRNKIKELVKEKAKQFDYDEEELACIEELDEIM